MLKKTLNILAKVSYEKSDFQILVPGDHVICAMTGEPIPIDELKYWSHKRQEAYKDAYASLQAEQNHKKNEKI